jgi:hypothetical protein
LLTSAHRAQLRGHALARDGERDGDGLAGADRRAVAGGVE